MSADLCAFCNERDANKYPSCDECATKDIRAEVETLRAQKLELLAMLEKHLAWFDGAFLPVSQEAFIHETIATIAKARGKK